MIHRKAAMRLIFSCSPVAGAIDSCTSGATEACSYCADDNTVGCCVVRNARSAPERNEVVQIRYHVPSNRVRRRLTGTLARGYFAN